MTYGAITAAAEAEALAIRGAFHPGPDDDAPEGTGTLILLGPDEPRFWTAFSASREYRDGAPDPLDRWSKARIGMLADRFGGHAVFPADGPPYAPFISWALATGRAHLAPVGLLVHDATGLWLSFRGALALPERLELPTPPAAPCPSCETRPCETACPVGALAPGQPYDVPRCAAHVASPEGAACRTGCLVRRACPISERFGRLPEQAAFHMSAFLGD
jgi:hypothetical protein